MAEGYDVVALFFQNADAYSAFRNRLAAALVNYARQERGDTPPDPVTYTWEARQNFCLLILNGKDGAFAIADRMMPALAVVANEAGKIDSSGNITVTDGEIDSFLTDNRIDWFAGHVPVGVQE